jgi:hypothetical protein
LLLCLLSRWVVGWLELLALPCGRAANHPPLLLTLRKTPPIDCPPRAIGSGKNGQIGTTHGHSMVPFFDARASDAYIFVTHAQPMLTRLENLNCAHPASVLDMGDSIATGQPDKLSMKNLSAKLSLITTMSENAKDTDPTDVDDGPVLAD